MAFFDTLLGNLAMLLKQPLPSFCDLETADGPYLLSRRGEYISLIRIDGLCRMPTRAEIDQKVESLRVDLQGLFDYPGHGIQAWYAADPSRARSAIDDLLELPRGMAEDIGLDLGDILDERASMLARLIRWECCYLVLWSRRSLLTRDEGRLADQEIADASAGAPKLQGTQTQNIFLATELLATKHRAFVQRVLTAVATQEISASELEPHEALVAIREALYPETQKSNWWPILPGDKLRPRMRDTPPKPGVVDFLLSPTLASQIFCDDAETDGLRVCRLGDHEWMAVEVTVGPEDTRPFAELVARLAAVNVPWRVSMWIEGGGGVYTAFKSTIATMLAFDPTNRSVQRAFEGLRAMKQQTGEGAVRWRCSFATWAPLGERSTLRRNAAMLGQRIQAWGNCQTGTTSGDPLESLIGSALGLTFGCPAPAGVAPLSHALRMMPLSRPAGPWVRGSVVWRSPDGKPFPYDPAGAGQEAKFALFIAPPRHGKSTLQNSRILGLCLSRASKGALGARLPLIGKIDIGRSAEGMILLLRDALPPERRDEALYLRLQFRDGFEFNIFETQLGCRQPLRLERAFIENFLNLITTPDDGDPFEGMSQFVALVIEEVYRIFGDTDTNATPKRYTTGVEPEIDRAIADLAFGNHQGDIWWWEVVDRLIETDNPELAALAQRHALPVLEDLLVAARSDRARADYGYDSGKTSETVPQAFERYIKAIIRKIPTLNRPTRLDLGQARVVVLDLQDVAPSGNSPDAVRTTSLMYMLARQILARNFFLHEEDIVHVPEAMRAWHLPRFREIQEVVKLLDYDEYHRTSASRPVRAQVNRDLLEGGKHNVQIAVTSQSIHHFDDDLIDNANELFILGAGKGEAEIMISRFKLSEAAAYVLRQRLNGPGPGGAPFLFVGTAYNTRYEQMLLNSLGPSELWALSTTPVNVHLRTRLYRRLGPAEARRRLAIVFPAGSAEKEIDRRNEDRRMITADDEDSINIGVADEIADEIYNGQGVGAALRHSGPDPVAQAPEPVPRAAE